MSSLIRQGSPGPAVVRVTLVNEGPDAYRTDTYGKRITVERTIVKGGSSNYKLLSSQGTVKFTKVCLLFDHVRTVIANMMVLFRS
jgi:chromosome segregation ATPase